MRQVYIIVTPDNRLMSYQWFATYIEAEVHADAIGGDVVSLDQYEHFFGPV